MKKAGQKTEKWLRNIVWAAFFLVVLFLTLTSLWESTAIVEEETNTYGRDALWLHAIFLLAAVTLLAFVLPRLERVSSKRLLLGLMLFAVVGGSLLVTITRVEPANDQKDLMLVAQQHVVDGNWLPSPYIQKHPHQLGMLLVVMLCTLVTNTEAAFLVQLLNILVLCGCYYCFYRITQRLFQSRRITNLMLVLLFCFFPLFFYVVWVYGNLPGLLFSLLAMLFLMRYIEKQRVWDGLLSVACIAVSVVMRQTNLIVLIAMVIYYVVHAVKHKRAAALGLAALCVLVALFANSLLAVLYGKLTNSDPPLGLPALSYVAMGLMESEYGPGWFGNANAQRFRNGFDNTEASKQLLVEESRKGIAEQLGKYAQNPLEGLGFFYRKATSMWNNPTFQCFWIGTRRDSQIESSPIARSIYNDTSLGNFLFTNFLNLLQSLLLVGVLAWTWARRRSASLVQLLPAMLVVGYFVFHLFIWEAKAQYALTAFVLLLPYAAAGLSPLAGRWRALLGRLNERRLHTKTGV